MKKLMVVAMVAIMSLGLLGVGYAMWQETLNITGTVGTGNVDIALSGPIIAETGAGELAKPTVANCGATIAPDGNSMVITVTNAYPSYECYVIFDVHGVGSVPAHVHRPAQSSGPTWVERVDAAITVPTASGPVAVPECYPQNAQVHNTNDPTTPLVDETTVWCALHIHFTNFDQLPNQVASYSFAFDIVGHQFNEP